MKATDFLEAVEKSASRLANSKDFKGLEFHTTIDTRGKFPSITLRVLNVDNKGPRKRAFKEPSKRAVFGE